MSPGTVAGLLPHMVESAGHFTLLDFLLSKPTRTLEKQLGYGVGVLASGWALLSPRHPIALSNINLHGSTRWVHGMVGTGSISFILEQRIDIMAARAKVAQFMDRDLRRRPAKVLPLRDRKTITYVPAAPIGVPQFKLFTKVQWMVLLHVDQGRLLDLSQVELALARWRGVALGMSIIHLLIAVT